MKFYIEDGIGTRVSLLIYPHKLQHFSMADNPTPEVVCTQSHTLRIIGEEDKIIDIEGSLPELQEFVKLMTDVMEISKD